MYQHPPVDSFLPLWPSYFQPTISFLSLLHCSKINLCLSPVPHKFLIQPKLSFCCSITFFSSIFYYSAVCNLRRMGLGRPGRGAALHAWWVGVLQLQLVVTSAAVSGSRGSSIPAGLLEGAWRVGSGGYGGSLVATCLCVSPMWVYIKPLVMHVTSFRAITHRAHTMT